MGFFGGGGGRAGGGAGGRTEGGAGGAGGRAEGGAGGAGGAGAFPVVGAEYALLSFATPHWTSAAQALFESRGMEAFDMRIIPTPRCIRATCGISLIFPGERGGELVDTVVRNGFPEESFMFVRLRAEKGGRWAVLE